MPTNIGPEGAKFNTLIPQINENADIQTAFRLYHYGEGSSGVGELNANSVAGHLDKLEFEKIDRAPEIIPLNADLNDYTESGFYAQDTNAKAATGSNYPEVPAGSTLKYAGLLRVINDGRSVYQEYHVSGIPDGRVYWRVSFGGQPFPTTGNAGWRTFAFQDHTHSQYISRTEANSTFLPLIKQKSIRVASIANDNYTLTKADEDSILLMNNDSTPHNLRIPQDSTDPNINIAIGTRITVIQSNNGQTSFIPNTGLVVLQSTPGNKLRQIWSVATLAKIASNTWVVYGDLEDSRTRIQRKAALGIFVQPDEPTIGVQDGDLWFW